MKKRILAACLALAIVLSLAACAKKEDSPASSGGTSTASPAETSSNVGSNDVWDPYTPYEETVSFTKSVTKLTNMNYDIDYESNPFADYVKEKFNIETKVAWEADANNYDQKVSLAIATGDIPDIMVVNRKIYQQLRDNDLIADMTDAYEKCISPFLREQLDSAGDRLFEEVLVDGRMMGVPSPSLGYCHNVLWIRKDWLDKLNLEAPQTIDEVLEVARTFVEKEAGGEGTVGFATNKSVYGGYNSWGGLDTLFSAYGAYPGWWLDKDGEPLYGSVAPEMKTALGVLRDLYAEGILDKEFAVRANEDVDALVASGKCGLWFSVWWPSGSLTPAMENDPDAEWIAVSAPTNSEGKFTTPESDPLQAILVVRKDYEHPEAIIKALNGSYDVLRGNGEGKEAYDAWTTEMPDLGWGFMPIPIEINYFNTIEVTLNDFERVIEEGGDENDLETVGYAGDFRNIQAYLKSGDPHADLNNYFFYMARVMGPKAATSDNVEFVPTAFYGTTDTMATRWTNLDTLESEMMLQIIMGEQPLDYFDSFVEQWYSTGGQTITDEVKAAMN